MREKSELRFELTDLGESRYRMALEFYNSEVALAAAQTGLELTNAVFERASGVAVDGRKSKSLCQRMSLLCHTQYPDRVSRLLIRVARERDVPVYSLADGPGIRRGFWIRTIKIATRRRANRTSHSW